MAVLHLFDQHGQLEAVFPLDKNLIRIGRDSELEISLRDSRVSREHAWIVLDGVRHRFEDRGSRNGSLLNDKAVDAHKRHWLRDGDQIRIGRHCLAYVTEDRVSQLASTQTEAWKTLRRGPGSEPAGSVYVLGASRVMQQLWERIRSVANTSATVLLLGESGSGKTLLAREIHRLSSRSEGPFVKVNCTAIPETLLESELFGYAANSGIHNADPKGKPGRFELAHGGTLFLDEIGDMPLPQQAKLLDVIEDRKVQRLAATKPVEVDIRIVSATARDLKVAMRAGHFREDLYHRLSRLVLELPPVRERPEDLPALVTSALARLETEIPKRITGIAPAAMDCLMAHHWPGNVRELENVLASALILCREDGAIEVEHLPEALRVTTKKAAVVLVKDDPDLSEIDRAKRDTLIRAIEQTGSLTKAAKKIGMSKQWVLKLAKRFGLQIERPGSSGTSITP